MEKKTEQFEVNSIIINEVQLILAEKRTSLSVLRTGIAVLALPLSVLSVLIATSKYYDVFHVMHLLLPLTALNLLLLVLGIYLIVRSMKRMLHYDHLIREIKQKYSVLAELMD
ncbi:MAG: hypothetical protein KJ737_17115 [Proteobacteria bacterium]|nr:hypothetical protein [Pseudomonadota bacterium]